ncbi:MAG: helix-hairpin-helix domain-containing protein [Leadbetterella sp.]|nr:helix-hairpin-helix domain-containing protein [Leadbetterella sp.]
MEKYAVDTPVTDPPPVEEADFVAEKFRFDPNKATFEQMTALGIPPRTATTLLNYRRKGGKFRYREDLQKIYSLKPEIYAALENWIDLPSKEDRRSTHPEKENKTAVRSSPHPAAFEPLKRNHDSTKAKVIKAPVPEAPVDINTADTTALKKIRGIGPVYASRIIRFRDALGGFHSTDQLDETYGIPPETLLILKKAVIIGSPVKRIPINETDTIKHPYLKAYQAKALLSYREQHGKFHDEEDLHKIKVLDEETIRKIKPYLKF